jgi:hypothetical protein
VIVAESRIGYRVTFPGPVGKVHAGIAATLVYVESPPEDDPTGEIQLAAQVLAYLKGVGVFDARSTGTGADVLLLADRATGTGTVWRHGKRIGTFHLERLPDREVGDAGVPH